MAPLFALILIIPDPIVPIKNEPSSKVTKQVSGSAVAESKYLLWLKGTAEYLSFIRLN